MKLFYKKKYDLFSNHFIFIIKLKMYLINIKKIFQKYLMCWNKTLISEFEILAQYFKILDYYLVYSVVLKTYERKEIIRRDSIFFSPFYFIFCYKLIGKRQILEKIENNFFWSSLI